MDGRTMAEAGGAGGADPAGARRRILVVEDEALIALMIEEMLEGIGFEPVGPAAEAGP